MKITPIEIRQHTFEKGMRGYKSDEVDAFLASLSQEWERVTGEYKMLKMQLELAEKELGKLKEVEMTLFRTLKTAEDTSAQVTEQANKAAEQYLVEARKQADDIVAEARKKSALMVQDAENQSRFLKDTILNDLKVMENDFKALENYKDNLGIQIRALASNAVDSVDRFEKKFAKQSLKDKLDEVAAQIKEELHTDTPHSEDHSEPTPVADLPPLTEREAAIPEAIPVDELPHSPIDESTSFTHESAPAGTTNTEEVAEHTTPQATLMEVSTSEPEPTETEAHASTESQESQPKKGGSFFDQI